jgi:hypothetical protein
MKYPSIELEQNRINPDTKIVQAMVTEHYTLCGLGPPAFSPFSKFKETDEKVICARCNKVINTYYKRLLKSDIPVIDYLVQFKEDNHTSLIL